MKLLSFGEILFDIYGEEKCLGGAPLNLAAHTAIQGANSSILSSVGIDELGELAIKRIEELGIDISYISKSGDKQTGKCIVTLNDNAVPMYNLLTDVAYDFIPSPDFNCGDEFDVFAFGTLALRSDYNFETVQEIIKSRVCKDIYCDINIRPPFYSDKSIMLCLENATILKISDEELPVVTDIAFKNSYNPEKAVYMISERFSQLKIIIVTCGKVGSYAYDCANKTIYSCDAKKVEVVSTVGAGDSFGATFLMSYLNENDIQTSLEKASEISAYVVSQKAAIPDDMKEFVKKIV